VVTATSDDELRTGMAEPGAARSAARVARATAGAWAAVTLVAVAAMILTGLAWGALATSDAIDNQGAAVSAVAYTTLGVLIVRRSGNLVGWLMIGEGAALAFLAAGSAYGVAGITAYPGRLPDPAVVGALAESDFVLVVAGIAGLLFFFPSGRLPSPRWHPVAIAGIALTGVMLAVFAVSPRRVALPAPGGVSLKFPNPLAIPPLRPVLAAARTGSFSALAVVTGVLWTLALAALITGYRTGDTRRRQQTKWLALAAAVIAACQLAGILASLAGPAGQPVLSVAYIIQPFAALYGIPVVMTIAILRHGLFDIDVIISRALVYTLLSAAITAVYAGIVIGIGTFAGHRGGPVLTIAAAVSIALLFHPLRQRARQLANRLVFGERATPYQVLSDFAGDMAAQLDLGEALDRMVTLLAGAAGATRVGVWIRVGAQLRPVAAWPRESAPAAAVDLRGGADLPVLDPPSRAVPVRHGTDLLGALSLRKPRNEPLTATEDSLLQHLASQAGLVLRNAQLTAELRAMIDELRASRRRLVEAQDAERRKIERNLHDGAQQQLVALAIQLGLLEESADDPAFIRELAPRLRADLRAALGDLRDLARGIYPPLLAEQGLITALQAQAARASVPVRIEADGVGRYPPDTESTVYFCALEALQNVAKHAAAERVTVRVSGSDGSLRFAVTDDGAGFNVADARAGSGLQGMSDRLAALGGTFDIRSQPGQGTTITGCLPAAQRAA
jgi:signal transduction histidine kinase